MRPKIVAQLSSVHSSDEELAPDRVARRLEEITSEIPLDILVVGWTERPDLFRMLTSAATRKSTQVFLWYPLLSDYPGFDESQLVVNSAAASSRGWAGYEGTGIQESFKQACPNNPQTLSRSLTALEACISSYEFDGVFLDKIRFPSPANGLQEVFSCFCPFCARKAAEEGLDLDEVKAALAAPKKGSHGPGARIPPGAEWLEALVPEQPVLQRFLRFRADSILRVVTETAERMSRIGKKTALDVFSPSLTPLVGQDLPALCHLAEWVKPMIYRFGTGPSSLRTEVPSLVRELGSILGASPRDAMAWAGARLPVLEEYTLEEVERVAPLELIRAETGRALRLCAGTPVYLGLESVFISGRMEVRPRHVEEILDIGVEQGVHGFVLSWDLLHTPLENLKPLKRFL